MKKLNSLFATLIFLFLLTGANAQSKPGAAYFNGKWSVLLKGTPSGDVTLLFVLENRNDSIAGIVQDTTGAEISKITNVELQDSEVTLYFSAQGYDLSLLLKKKDDDHVSGSLMNMFDAEGDRVKMK